MKLTRATLQAIKYACLHYHYSKSVPANPLGYNIYNDSGDWCGVVIFGMGATNNIGCPYNLPQGAVLELVRVALNGKQEQTSKAVSMSLKQLKKDVPQCRLVVSYADCDQHHLGTIYQATNWIYTGTNNKNSRGGVDNSWQKDTPQNHLFTNSYYKRGEKALPTNNRSRAEIFRPRSD